jgi:hypothetical protein
MYIKQSCINILFQCSWAPANKIQCLIIDQLSFSKFVSYFYIVAYFVTL